MDLAQLTDALIDVAGALRPTPGTTESQLEAARRDIARALVGGQTTETMRGGLLRSPMAAAARALIDEARSRIANIAKTILIESASSKAPPAPFVYLRSTPIRSDFDSATPDWARGMQASRSDGPFVTAEGIYIWIDILHNVKRVALVRGPAKEVVAHLPILINTHGTTNVINLAKGSVWISAMQISPLSPAGSYTGIRILKGTLQLNAPVSIVNNTIQLSPQATAGLTLALDPPAAGAASNGPGADAANSICNLPKTVAFDILQNQIKVKELAEFDITVYGKKFNFKDSPSPPKYDAATKHIFIFRDVTPLDFQIDKNAQSSKSLSLENKAAVSSGAWALPVAESPSGPLSDASGAGAAAVAVSGGWTARWTGHAESVNLRKALLLLTPSNIVIVAGLTKIRTRQTFVLWKESGERERNSTVVLELNNNSNITYISSPGFEVLSLTGEAAAHTDRPLQTDGAPFAMKTGAATAKIIESPAGKILLAFGEPAAASPAKPASIALDNVLLRVLQPRFLLLVGNVGLSNGYNTIIPSGSFYCNFPAQGILPTLPDPYAGDFRGKFVQKGNIGAVNSDASWSSPQTAKLNFTISLSEFSGEGRRPEFLRERDKVGQLGFLSLLDVSTNADQLGVMLATEKTTDIVVEDLSLSSAGKNIYVFTVPEISWEPMHRDPSSAISSDSTVAEVEKSLENPPDDGGPSGIHVDTVHLVPVTPKATLDLCMKRIGAGDKADVYITLPFGLRGHAEINNNTIAAGGVFQLNAPKFSELAGALQIVMKPPGSDTNEKAVFEGDATSVGPYADAVLSKDITTIFNNNFASDGGDHLGLPVRRYDISGYGASVFSDWRDPKAADTPGVKIIKAQFDVFVGRTAYEVIKAKSVLFPWDVKVIRTITIDRKAAGWVNRYDSGWQAATDGTFGYKYSLTFNGRVHSGAVTGIYNVRNIREDGAQFSANLGSTFTFRPVLFDADVQINSSLKVKSGGFTIPGKPGTFVTSRDMKGYIQIQPSDLVDRTQLATLLDKVGPTGGNINCIVKVGATGTQKGIDLRAASVDVTYADKLNTSKLADPDIVATLRGSVVLPGDGAWSIGRRGANDPAPSQISSKSGVPLVQKAGTTVWNIADPEDVTRLDAPLSQYGFLQSTGTQKIFFPQPRMQQGSQRIQFKEVPSLADVGALLKATGLFPNLNDTIKFERNENAEVTTNGLNINDAFTIPDGVPARSIIDFGPVRVDMDYSDNNDANTNVTVVVSSEASPRWKVTLEKVRFRVFIGGSDPLLQIVGTVYADSDTAPVFKNLNVVYGGMLETITTIFSNLSKVAESLPDGGESGLKVSFTNGKLTVRESFALPKLPLGFGQITDVSLNIGLAVQLMPQSLEFSVGIGSTEKPFHWLYSPLSGTGVIEVGTRDGNLQLLVEAGLGVGLAIDVGIASGSASIVLRFRVDNKTQPFQITVLLTGQATVDVLEGLASASLTLTAGLGIVPHSVGEVELIGSAAVGIHISICWIIDIDFDGEWQFSQTLSSPID